MTTRKQREQSQPAPPLRQKDPKDQLPKLHAFDPPPYENADIGALKALAAGNAGPLEQKRALDYIVHVACATYDWSFRPDARETDVMLGRQFAGRHIVYLVNYDLSKLKLER